MTEWDDHELLAEYARTESEAAFATLVERYVNLVHSAAWRFTGNPHHTEEITQAVFIILARKAGGLRRGTVLSGWLYQTARLTAANFVKGEIRRQRREQEAYMQSTLTGPEPAAWTQIAPLLDEAMGQLGETDRNAVVLRFFENKTAQEVGVALKLTEAAVHKRVNRALEKLRKLFMKRGVMLSAAVIAGTVLANSVQAAPMGLAATVAAAAAKETTLSATLTTLVKGTMKTMTWIKLKFAAGVGVAALLAGGVSTVAISKTGGGDKPTPQQITRQAQDAYAALSSYSDTGTNISTVAGQTITTTSSIKLQRPNLYRIDWTQSLESAAFKRVMSKGVTWSDGTDNYWVFFVPGQEQNARPEKSKDMHSALISASAAAGGWMVSTIPELFFNQNWSGMLDAADQTLKRQKDESVNGVDCYVVSSSTDPATADAMGKRSTTLWIGRRDHFIHKTQMIIEKISMATIPQASDADIKKVLEMQNQPATPEAIAKFRPILEQTLKQTQKLMNSGKFVYTQTRGNISVNEQFPLSDFDR
jgi:RNA polymerase sigma factor (sigma-70 family)